MTAAKQYIGDSVYAEYAEYVIILTTEQGDDIPTNSIILEPAVLCDLIRFAEDHNFINKGEPNE